MAKPTKALGNYVVDRDGARVAAFALEEDMNLFQSAPQLLAALEALLIEKSEEVNADGLEPGEESHGWTRFSECDPNGNWHRAKQLIAKATGGE